MSDPKNQHYVPQFLLRGFTSTIAPGKVYHYKNGKSYWSHVGIEQVASEDYIHSFVGQDGNLNHDLEVGLSQLERIFSPVVKKVLDREGLSPEEELTFASFVAVAWNRVPTEVEHFSRQFGAVAQKHLQMLHAQYSRNPSLFERWKEQYKADTGRDDLDDLTISDLECDPSRFTITASPHITLAMLLRSATDLAEIICRMNWTFLEAQPPDTFIISDHPFCIYDPTNLSTFYGIGLSHANVDISLPLSRNVAFTAGWKVPGPRLWLPATTKAVEVINMRTAKNAERELIAADRDFPGSKLPMNDFYTPRNADGRNRSSTPNKEGQR